MSPHRRRPILIVALATPVVLLAAGVPWALDGLRAGHPRPGSTHERLAPTVRIAEQLGDAVRLVAKGTVYRPAGPRRIAAVADAEQAFGIALLHQLASRDAQNVSTSPASLAIALAMLQNGARGSTRAAIAATLRSAGLSSTQQDEGWSALTSSLAATAAKDGVTLESANSVWQQRGMQLDPGLLAALARYYDTGVWQVDFAGSGAADAINRWTRQRTHGRIDKLFEDGQLDASTRLVLANAVYFKAAWADPFAASDSVDGRFTLGSGRTVAARFMSKHGTALRSAITPGYQAVALPYAGGHLEALAIMPTSGSLPDYLAGLSADSLRAVVGSLRAQRVDLQLPRFTTSSTLDLNAALTALGMGVAFSGRADLSGIADEPLAVQQVTQRVYLAVGEKGTEAAAVTGVAVKLLSGVANAPEQIRLDHPFLFLVRDVRTGAILFASTIEHPAG